MEVVYIEFNRDEKHASKGAEISDRLDAFRDAGYLLEKDDVIIDIDSLPKESIKALLEWFNIKTKRVWTDRGVHLYYKKPLSFGKAKNGVCRLGFPIEMKTSSNTPNGITVKRKGVERLVENENIREELPEIFNDRKQYAKLTGYGNGDGRNNALFAHKMKLANCKDWDLVLKFINKYVFDEPLSDEEFESVSRSQASSAAEAEVFTTAMKITNVYKTCKYNRTLWWYDGTRYITDTDNDSFIDRICEQFPDKPRKFLDEVVWRVWHHSKKIEDPCFPIKFKNGVLMTDGKFVKMDYDDFTPYCIDINYYKDAAPVEFVDNYINQLTNNDPDYKKLLLQVLGFSLVTDMERTRSLGRFFMFRGDGRNGKGTLLQIIQCILNEENCSSMSIRQLADPKYCISMIGKLVNLGDDIEGDAINNDQMKVLKNISTADRTEVRHLYKEGESVQISTKLYFTTNSDVKSYEKGYAYKRRVLWLPMFTKVEKVDPQFITKITTREALEYWVRLFVEGCQSLLEEGWHESQVVEDYNNTYHDSNNVMLSFIKDTDVDVNILDHTMNEVRAYFSDWADDETQKFSARLLKESLWDLYKIGIGKLKQNGRTQRCFMRQDETTQDLRPK